MGESRSSSRRGGTGAASNDGKVAASLVLMPNSGYGYGGSRRGTESGRNRSRSGSRRRSRDRKRQRSSGCEGRRRSRREDVIQDSASIARKKTMSPRRVDLCRRRPSHPQGKKTSRPRPRKRREKGRKTKGRKMIGTVKRRRQREGMIRNVERRERRKRRRNGKRRKIERETGRE